MISPFYLKHKSNVVIYIFKTNIKTKKDINAIQTLLRSNLRIIESSIDIEDIDKVLRIEARETLSERAIIELVSSKGFNCEVLS